MLRSTFAGLNTMYRGISTNRTSLETTGHNMTNSSVEGYSRQMVNQAATMADGTYSSYGQVYIGSGTDALSITRARDVYADKQYQRDNADMEYDYARQKNYQKLEVIFNDSEDTGIRNAISTFTKSLTNIVGKGEDKDLRDLIVESAKKMTSYIAEAAENLQKQIEAEYDDLQILANRANTLIEGIVQANKAIALAEAPGGYANDLRDERDNLVDELSGYMSISVTENQANGMYTVVCNGASIVNGITKIPLTVGPKYDDGRQPGIPNKYYGVTDYNLELGDTGVMLDTLSGSLAAKFDNIAEDKSYIDELVSLSAFLLSDFNAQHKMGIGVSNFSFSKLNDTGVDAMDMDSIVELLNGYTGVNFFGEEGKAYLWDSENNCLNVVGQTVKIEPRTDTDPDPQSTDTSQHHFYDFTVTTEKVDHSNDLNGLQIINALKVTTEMQTDLGKFAARSLNTASQISYEVTNPYDLDTAPDIWKAYVPDVSESEQVMRFTLDTMRRPGGGEDSRDKDNNRDQLNNIADGSNSQLLYRIMNQNKDKEMATVYSTESALDGIGVQNHYRLAMMTLSVNSEAMNVKVLAQEDLLDQVIQWRTSVAGVNWDEELTNMIMFQQGYSACSRCLTTMDEMLDRLINSTSEVGR